MLKSDSRDTDRSQNINNFLADRDHHSPVHRRPGWVSFSICNFHIFRVHVVCQVTVRAEINFFFKLSFFIFQEVDQLVSDSDSDGDYQRRTAGERNRNKAKGADLVNRFLGYSGLVSLESLFSKHVSEVVRFPCFTASNVIISLFTVCLAIIIHAPMTCCVWL